MNRQHDVRLCYMLRQVADGFMLFMEVVLLWYRYTYMISMKKQPYGTMVPVDL